jgi:RNA polymerase sigma-54 factor
MLKPALQLRHTQQLTMTPQLQQAIKLLQLPVLELQAQVQQALETNVMLEAEEELEEEQSAEMVSIEQGVAAEPAGEGDEESAPAREEVTIETVDPWEDNSGPAGERRAQDDDDRVLEFEDESGRSLQQHLVWQLETSPLDPRQVWIGEAIIDALNEDGYLLDTTTADISAHLATELPVTSDEVEQVLAYIQTFDPAGVGARSVSECICLQLAQLDADTPGRELALRIAQEHLQDVADHDASGLRRALGSDDEALQDALALIQGCQPRPGSAFQTTKPEYIEPDVFVRRTAHGWSVEINPGSVPRLRVNQSYAGVIARSADYAALRSQLQEARWLIRSLEIRNETLLKVARTIVQRQTAFLEKGDEAMEPMILRDVAEAVSMHESTISRVTTGKYMRTPRGIFEFRHFFSSHVSGIDGADVSSVAIRARIRRLIADEDPARPLSDAQLAQLLAADGVKVARRTVAKYRESLRLASSSERRQAPPGQQA